MTVDDIGAGLRLCRQSGWNQLEADWRCFLDSPDGEGRLAERDGVPVGSVTVLRYGGFSWIAMMLVDPAERRSGIGSRLMESALEALAGESCVRLDATPAGEPLYRRFGFEAEYELVRTKATGSASRFRPAAGARPMESADLASVLVRDREVFGGDRGEVLRSFYRRAPEMAWVADGGYCFGRAGYLYRHLGPVVAGDLETARGLAAAVLGGQEGKAVALDVPRLNSEWLGALQSVGFEIERPFLRMCRGGLLRRGLPERQFAIAGPEFG